VTISEPTAYKYVYLPDYVDVIDVPVVPFVLVELLVGTALVSAPGPLEQLLDADERVVATRMTIDRSAARISRAAMRDAAIAEGRTPRAGVAERVTRELRSAC